MYLSNLMSFELQKNHSFIPNAWQGTKWGMIAFPMKVIAFKIVNKIVARSFSSELFRTNTVKIYPIDLVYPIIIGPLLEETISKLLIQNGICKIQNITKNYTVSWINSPKTRIMLSGLIFAIPHLMGDSLDKASAIARVAFLILIPTEAILFEKFGFTSAFFAHATHNALGLIFFRYIT